MAISFADPLEDMADGLNLWKVAGSTFKA